MAETIDNVKSTDISWMSWDCKGTLQLKFQDDCIYFYKDVPKVNWNALKRRNARRDLKDKSTDKNSVGKYFNKEIKGVYKFTKVCP